MTSRKRQTTKAKSAKARGGQKWLAAVLIAMAFFAVVRLRLADVPLERDEGEYAYSGQLILQGIPPYQSAYNMKFPGTYYAYSVMLALFGHTALGIHLGLLIVNAATILLVYFLARRLLADPMAAAVSAIAFGVLSLDRWIMGIFGHATHFVVLAAVAGLFVLVLALDSGKRLAFAAAGACLGLSVLMKQNGIFFFALAFAWILLDQWSHTPRDFRAALFRAGFLSAGGAIPFAALVVVLSAQGVLGRFWFWTVQYAQEYVSRSAFSWRTFSSAVTTITQANGLIWVLAAAGVALLWIVRWSPRTRLFLMAFAGASLIAVCPGFYFREHYFILLLPAAGLFCGVAAGSIQRLLNGILPVSAAHAVAAGVFSAALASYAVAEGDYLFSMSPQSVSQERYGSNPFAQSPEIARYVREHTNQSDVVAVLGSEPQIYFYANRRSATGYIYTYPLMEQQKYSVRMQDEMIQEITAAYPKYLVYVGIPASWLTRNPKEKILVWAEAYMSKCYSVVGVAEVVPGGDGQYVWDEAAASYRPRSPFAVYTLKRKADVPCGVPN